jgi:hopanoid biosynthesis associated RND transporter like protein HpnN
LGWKSLTLEQLLNEGERRAQALSASTPSPGSAAYFKQLAAICASAAAYVDRERYGNPWLSMTPDSGDQLQLMAKPQFFFSDDAKLAFLLVRPIFRETGSFTAEKACIDQMRGLIDAVRGNYPDLDFGLTGLPVLENDEMLVSQGDSQQASWLALLGVALLYLIVYRGLRYPLMTVATLLLGTIWALGWLTLTIGHLNILSSAFAVMLIGMGDYGVLWVARFEQESRGGMHPAKAMRLTALHVGPSILTAACTTALAFFAAMLADLKAVAELGWIAGCGVLFCALACFIALPALLTLFGAPRQTTSGAPIIPWKDVQEQNRSWLPWLIARPKGVIIATIVAVAVLGWFACQVRYDHNLLHLQAQHLDSVRWEKTLIDHTAGASWHALSTTTTREEAIALKQRFEALPLVSRVVEVASLVPLDQERKLEQLRDIQERLRRLPERGKTIPHNLPKVSDVVRSAEKLEASLARLRQAHPDVQLGALPETLKGLLGRLRVSPGADAASPPDTVSTRLRDYQQLLTRDLVERLHQLRDVSQPRPIEVADVPACMRERYVGQNGKWLLRVFCKDCLWDYGPLESFVAQIASVDPDATGKPFTTLEGLKAMKNGFLWAGVYALLVMLLVLLLDFGKLKHVGLALAPLVVGVIATLGLMGLFGVPLNPANLIAFPLILGVGADNGVHVVHDYRQRLGGKRYLLHHATGRGILVAALTTILGFGALMIGQHIGLASLGKVLFIGVTCCMAASLVFLPCLLSLLSVRKTPMTTATVPFNKHTA